MYCSIIITFCQNGWSSLILASDDGHMEVVGKLLEHGATVDLKNQVMTTPTSISHNEVYNFNLVICHHHTINL